MPDPNACDLTLIVDRSGSMASIKGATEEAVNGFLHEQRLVPGRCLVTLVEFDHEYRFVHRGVPVEDVPAYVLMPRGNTALHDAIGRAVAEAVDRLNAIPERTRPSRVVFVIATDGQENHSREYTAAKVRELVVRYQTIGWDFVFLGANIDAFAVGGALGVARQNIGQSAATDEGVKGLVRTASAGVAANRLHAAGGAGMLSKVAYLAPQGADEPK